MPMVCIVSNAGWTPTSGKVGRNKEVNLDELKTGEGFNSKTEKIENMIDAGIVDPTDVVLNALKNAISVAAGILTVGTVVILPKEDPQFIMQGVVNG